MIAIISTPIWWLATHPIVAAAAFLVEGVVFASLIIAYRRRQR